MQNTQNHIIKLAIFFFQNHVKLAILFFYAFLRDNIITVLP